MRCTHQKVAGQWLGSVESQNAGIRMPAVPDEARASAPQGQQIPSLLMYVMLAGLGGNIPAVTCSVVLGAACRNHAMELIVHGWARRRK
jgi:hypothetical protein